MDVCGGEIEDGTEGCGVLDNDAERFGGGDGAGVTGLCESGAGVGDESGEVGGAAKVVEDGLVADNDHFDRGPGVA